MHPLFRGTAVIPVLTIEREAHAVPLARALYDGGLKIIEVTFRTESAAASIAAIAARAAAGDGWRRHVVARQAMSARRCAPARKFLVSPGTTPELAGAALATELPYLPGVATPSEIMAARALGICVMKLFPAEAMGGIALLRALAPVFPGIAFCPTGGIDERTAAALLGAAQCADGRRLVDGAARCDRRRRLGPHPPPRRTRRRDRPRASGLKRRA